MAAQKAAGCRARAQSFGRRGRGAGDVVDQAGLVAGKAIKPALTAHQFQGQANQPGAQHLGRTDHIDQGLQAAGGGQGAGGVEPTTEQPAQGTGLNGGRVVIATLHHRQGVSPMVSTSPGWISSPA